MRRTQPFVAGGHIWLLILPVLIVLGIVVIASRMSGRGGAATRPLRECPACKETMRRDASVCPHCRTPSEAWSFSEGRWWVQRAGGRSYLDERSGTWSAVPDPPQHHSR